MYFASLNYFLFILFSLQYIGKAAAQWQLACQTLQAVKIRNRFIHRLTFTESLGLDILRLSHCLTCEVRLEAKLPRNSDRVRVK